MCLIEDQESLPKIKQMMMTSKEAYIEVLIKTSQELDN